MAYAKQLTRQELEDMGIYSVLKDDGAPYGWRIRRRWYKNNGKERTNDYEIKITEAVTKHPYGKDKSYPIVVFGYRGKTKSYALSRFLYAWFFGEVPSGLCVDHLDNNPFENSLKNLEAKSALLNNQKRFLDILHCTCFNQIKNSVLSRNNAIVDNEDK